ncbi:11084_t:CDS:2 [Funneliformis caledonium]|uniref:11084_t:CDS:1 n=1 Tax=Funneliformis caledonium TaxID=1117310 RepID=A0A9N9B954_9GLOM|nr:11084_t:CDS:2 [Funneliformis caledonium]
MPPKKVLLYCLVLSKPKTFTFSVRYNNNYTIALPTANHIHLIVIVPDILTTAAIRDNKIITRLDKIVKNVEDIDKNIEDMKKKKSSEQISVVIKGI